MQMKQQQRTTSYCAGYTVAVCSPVWKQQQRTTSPFWQLHLLPRLGGNNNKELQASQAGKDRDRDKRARIHSRNNNKELQEEPCRGSQSRPDRGARARNNNKELQVKQYLENFAKGIGLPQLSRNNNKELQGQCWLCGGYGRLNLNIDLPEYIETTTKNYKKIVQPSIEYVTGAKTTKQQQRTTSLTASALLCFNLMPLYTGWKQQQRTTSGSALQAPRTSCTSG